MTEGYIPKADRKNILLLCDDIRMHSGIATMGREIVLGTANQFNWYNLEQLSSPLTMVKYLIYQQTLILNLELEMDL